MGARETKKAEAFTMTLLGLGLGIAFSPIPGGARLAPALIGDRAASRFTGGLWLAGATAAATIIGGPALGSTVAAAGKLEEELADALSQPARAIRKAWRRGLFP